MSQAHIRHAYVLVLTTLQDDGGPMFEEDVLCLLDFYVHETLQRKGIGRVLFEYALKVRRSTLIE